MMEIISMLQEAGAEASKLASAGATNGSFTLGVAGAGAGLGIGTVFGNIYQITNNSGCTAENAGDPTKCYPTNVGKIENTDAATIEKLNAAGCVGDNDKLDTPTSPCQRSTQSYPFNPRVVPVLNTLIGLRFKLQDHVYWHLDGGWRLVGFYVGGGPEFRF